MFRLSYSNNHADIYEHKCKCYHNSRNFHKQMRCKDFNNNIIPLKYIHDTTCVIICISTMFLC